MLVSSRIIAQGSQFHTRSSMARRESVAATIWAFRISLIRACRRASLSTTKPWRTASSSCPHDWRCSWLTTRRRPLDNSCRRDSRRRFWPASSGCVRSMIVLGKISQRRRTSGNCGTPSLSTLPALNSSLVKNASATRRMATSTAALACASQQYPLTTVNQGPDNLGEAGRLSRTGRTPHEGQTIAYTTTERNSLRGIRHKSGDTPSGEHLHSPCCRLGVFDGRKLLQSQQSYRQANIHSRPLHFLLESLP